LLQYTKGRANEAIHSCSLIGGEAGYKQARAVLEQRFGNGHIIADKVIKNLKNGRPVKSAEDLVRLADELNNGMLVLENLNKLYEVDTQSSIVDIVNRLQPYLKNRWRRSAMEFKRTENVYPSFKKLVAFIEEEASDACDPVYGQTMTTRKSSEESKPKGPVVSYSTTTGSSKPFKQVKACLLCGENHRLFYCQTFKEMRPRKRLEFVNDRRLCHNCLLDNHATSNCRKPSVCSVEGCGAKHTKFIHVEPNSVSHEVTSNRVETEDLSDEFFDDVMIPVVPVVANDNCRVLAILDPASTTSFCTQELVDRLGINGKSVTYLMHTMSRTQETKCSNVVNLSLKSEDGVSSLHLRRVFVVDKIPLRIPVSDLSKYPHLHDMHFENNVADDVHILLGQDNCEALVPLEVRKGSKPGDPFAVRTLFGWSINGPMPSTRPVSKRIVSHFITASAEDEINSGWKLEGDNGIDDDLGMSQIDAQVVKLWDEKARVVAGGHYEIPLPWKTDAVCLITSEWRRQD
jgi:hypothetical protein